MSPASASTLVWCEIVGCDLPERFLEVARADLTGVGHQAEQPEPHRIGHGREHRRQVLGVGLGQRCGEHRRAAHVVRSLTTFD